MKTRTILAIAAAIFASGALGCFAGAAEEKPTGQEKSVSAETGDAYTWPTYNPNLNYNYKKDHPDFKPPTKVLDDVKGVENTITSGWWCFRYGKDKNPLVTEAAWKPMLERFNQEFAYYRDEMGWPPDKRAKEGYYSTIYLFGSGMNTDQAKNTEKGGWMGNVHYQGQDWAMVLISYYPVYCFDPNCDYKDKDYQTGSSIHEGVHAILAGMPGCKKAGWFHEGGNNWLQAVANAKRTNNYKAMGWLSAGAMLAPFMPIECYSGWLQDGSFGGPSAEGVNRNKNGKQLCTWRKLLGGTQYGECFPMFLGEIVSPGAVAWVWENCPERVLEGIATAKGGLGDAQTRHLIKEFRGRQAMCDFGNWSSAFKDLLNKSWGLEIGAEFDPVWIKCQPWKATCYAAAAYDENTRKLTPEERTLPGWSGANQIPLTVSGDDIASVDFQPLGENMSCQLVYRATDGSVVYSTPVDKGTCALKLQKPVKNNVVVAVVCNTDYVFKGDDTRKAKYNYNLILGKGISGTADIYRKWYE